MVVRKYSFLFGAAAIILFSLASCNGVERTGSSSPYQKQVDSVLSMMSPDEKIGQMSTFTSGWTVTGPVLDENYMNYVRTGNTGSLFNAHTVEYNRKLQKMAVEETRLGIPLVFGYDVIHGYKTIFPIPLAEACSWDLDLIEKSAQLAAKEAASAGLNWTFNPMVDICRDPRWGRIAEGAGEDAYLGSLIAAAKVRGYQGDDLSDPLSLAACVKHYAAYGAPQGGRDYNAVDMSELVLREYYLPPYHAAVDAGVASLMTSFNELFGVPATANKFLLKKVLRGEWKFDGMVVTDYTSMNEMVAHGYARDLKHAGELALAAGVDMDMQGSVYLDYLKESLEEGNVDMEMINQAVRRILDFKFKLGLFDDPYRYLDADREKENVLSREMLDHSFESGKRSIVLLKNDPAGGKKLLPLTGHIREIAVIGPLGDDQLDVLGAWHASGVSDSVVTVAEGLRKRFPGTRITVVRGCDINGDDQSGFGEAISAAMRADLVVLAVGEAFDQSGEAASRADIGLPGQQLKLIQAVHKTGKPVIGVVMAGRPLTINWLTENVPAIVYAWHLGTRNGDALASVLSGDYNPSGKLVVTIPRSVGQIPIHYNMKNTGRPVTDQKYTSRYLDISNDPLYPFGFGLSYTTFRYSNLQVSLPELNFDEELSISADVENTGDYAGEEVVQLYTRDLVGSVTRPVKELKGFKKINLDPGEKITVTFTLTSDDLRFYNQEMDYAAEPGEFKVFVGTSSADCLEGGFTLIANQAVTRDK